MLLLSLPVALNAQFTYTTNNGAIAITRYTGSGGEVSIPDTIDGLPVTGIGSGAFRQCDGLTSISIPGSVASIGVQAFYGCTNLTAIEVDAENPSYSSVEGVLFNKSQAELIAYPGGRSGPYAIPDTVTTVGFGAFYGCAGLTSVAIPDRVTSIGIEAFQGCSSLASVTIPDSVTDVGSSAFVLCTSLASVTIPNNVTKIWNSTFAVCTSLPTVTIPDRVSSIGLMAFFHCTSLRTATIGHSVTNMSSEAFNECASLTGLFFEGNAPTLFPFGFGAGTNTTVYYLPGTQGWGPTFGSLPTALWVRPYPVILTTPPDFGVRTNQFGFIISWATNASVVVEACPDLVLPDWSPVATSTLVEGWSYFSDPEWTNHANRFYRLRSP